MNKEEKKELKALVRTMYDYQDMRIITKGRINATCGEDVEVNKKFMDEAIINEKEYSAIEYTLATSIKTEKRLMKEIKKIVHQEPIWKEFLINVRGCGELMAAAILSEFDIHIATTRSKMYQFAGLNPGSVQGKEILKITKKTDISKYEVIREYENQKGDKCAIVLSDEMIRGDKKTKGFLCPYNSWLRTKLLGVLADTMIRASGGESGINYAMKFYYPYKARLEQEENQVMHLGKMTAWKDVSKGHRDRAAKRYMIKNFLSDLYEHWRAIEGLEVRKSYQEDYLGHKHNAV